MNDPYKVLNVPSTASDEEVKKAYRELARKYHPDNYHDNPLADLAQEKMKEINEAYDTIQKMRQRGGQASYERQSSGYGQSPYGGYGYGGYRQADYSQGTPFQRIRFAIQRNDLNTAEQLLNTISDHTAEWYFLRGAICMRRGWLDEARRSFQQACAMDPGNPEYRQALERLESSGQAYRPAGFEVFTTDCGTGNLCGGLLCSYCLCNSCIGGTMCC